MQSGSAPIGFEGIFSDQSTSLIGFEQYEIQQQENAMPIYPRDDAMPAPNRSFLTNSYSSSSIPKISSSSSHSHSPKNTIHSHNSSRKSVSYLQLFATYTEIMNEWCQIQWLTFVNDHTHIYLTLDPKIDQTLTIQMAINQYHLKSGGTLISSQPECLLIRTQAKSKTFFIPNSFISLERLLVDHINERLFRYKLMAIICHSNETNSKIMFYKDFQSNCWYIYYDQSIISHSHSNLLSNDEEYQLESFIQQTNHLDLSRLKSPLSALCNHPIIYVYIPEKINDL